MLVAQMMQSRAFRKEALFLNIMGECKEIIILFRDGKDNFDKY
jgi:hypothetical protein